MGFHLLDLDWIGRDEWWLSVGEIETSDKQGFLLLIGRNEGRWELDFLWLGLLNVRFT